MTKIVVPRTIILTVAKTQVHHDQKCLQTPFATKRN